MEIEDSPSVIDWDTAPEEIRASRDEAVARSKAAEEKAKTLEEKLATFERRETFERVLKEVGELPVEISLDDLEGVKAEEITATLLKVKAQEKQEAKQVALKAQAAALGFESVEDFEATLKRAKDEREKERKDLEAQAGMASAGSAQPPAEPQGQEKHWDKVKEAKKKGGSRAAQAEALIESKLETALEEGEKARSG